MPRWLIPATALAWIVAASFGIAAAGDGVLSGDVRVARWVQRADSSVAESVAAFGNWAGAYLTGAGLSVVVVLILTWRRQWAEIALLGAVLLVRALNATVKGWVDSPRPTADLIRVTEDADSLGFPSGHASGAMLFFGALAWIGWVTLRAGLARTVVAGLCFLTVGIVGYGRISTGAHWPSDVLGGYILGLAVLGTLVFAIGRVPRWERAR